MEAEKANKTKGTLNSPTNSTKSLKASSTLPTNNFNTMTKLNREKFLKLQAQAQAQVVTSSFSPKSINNSIFSIQGIKNPKNKLKPFKELGPKSMQLRQKESALKN
jgi:hypothetical protein